jgi:threonine/homoserine/homoserine lactone efflux protein
MWQYLLFGGSLAFTAALQPGPLQAFFLAKVSQVGWRKTLPAAFGPLVSDGPIALITLLLIQQIPPIVENWLRLAGGLLLLFYAWRTFRSWRSPDPQLEEKTSSAPDTVFQAGLINLLNPNPYLGWALIMGPTLLEAWAARPRYALGLLAVFYLVMIGVSMILIFLMGTSRFLSSSGRQTLLLISSLILAGLGLYYLISAGQGLLPILG